MTSSTSQTAQLQIRFVTKQEQYAVPDSPFAVPAKIKTSELNSLVNQLIREADSDRSGKDIEFDFLAVGEFVRTELGAHLEARNHSTEAVIDVEYLERLPAPQPQDCLLHDDWVSSVQANSNWILTGCYDNTLHLWTTKGIHQLTIPAHTAAVKAVSWVSVGESVSTFVSGSQDQSAILWELRTEENQVECVHVCKGHARGIECIGVSPDETRFASGAWDNLLKIWSTSLEDEDGETEEKRFKNDGKAHIKTPIITLKGHKEVVSGLTWRDDVELATCSWDHTIRIWDTEMSSSVQELSGNKAFFDVDSSPVNRLLIAACADKNIRLYDPRSHEGQICKTTFVSHTEWVMSTRWSKTEEYLFVSASNDKSVKLWDTRSPQVPLFDMSGHEDKVLSCDWSIPDLVVSGGCDNTLRIFKVHRGAGDC